MASEWIDVKGYEGIYAVNRKGEIKSLERTIYQQGFGYRKLKEHLMKPFDNGHGYMIVALRKDGKSTNHYVHRLVADHFIHNPNNYPEVNHIDYDRSNNGVDNLEWVNRKMNVKHSIKNMKHPRMDKPYSNTGYAYISKCKDGAYQVTVNGQGKRVKSIEDALKTRDLMIKERQKCETAS